MRSRNPLYARNVADLVEEARNPFGEGARAGESFGAASGDLSAVRPGAGSSLAIVAGQLQAAAGDLDGMMFESLDINAPCRAELHDAVALLMEALQAVGRAKAALDHPRETRPSLSGAFLAVPMARA